MAKYPHTDHIRSVLGGTSDLVQQRGLNYLIPAWERFARGYVDSGDLIYEWLNDLDTRMIIDKVLAVLPDADKQPIEDDLRPLDARVMEKTFEVNECVWGAEAERTYQFNRVKNWYYYRLNQFVFEAEAGRFTKRK